MPLVNATNTNTSGGMASRSNALASRMRLSVSLFTYHPAEAHGLLDIVLFDQPGNRQAYYAALTGDPDRMVSFLQRAVDAGYAAVFGFLPATLDRYRGEPRFIELENEVIRRGNEERRKLGLVAPTA
jgi:hypothetical protein